MFDRTHLPLQSWLRAMWSLTSQEQGASALGIQRDFGLGSYRTAWSLLQKLRRAMVCAGRDVLRGEVEVDEIHVAGPEVGVHDRGSAERTIVAVAAERLNERRIGRIRLSVLSDLTARSLSGFVRSAVAPDSVVYTDGFEGYAGLKRLGYRHWPLRRTGSGRTRHKLMPLVGRVASRLRKWLKGTLRGGVQDSHLAYYLDEFTFRFNQRGSRKRGLLFYRLLQRAATHAPIPNRALVARPRAARDRM